MNTIVFDWEESIDKRKHFYAFAGYNSNRLGFVAYQRRGWKAKAYLPGCKAQWFGSQDLAEHYVQECIKAFVNSIEFANKELVEP